jgi:hypothetical protein
MESGQCDELEAPAPSSPPSRPRHPHRRHHLHTIHNNQCLSPASCLRFYTLRIFYTNIEIEFAIYHLSYAPPGSSPWSGGSLLQLSELATKLGPKLIHSAIPSTTLVCSHTQALGTPLQGSVVTRANCRISWATGWGLGISSPPFRVKVC